MRNLRRRMEALQNVLSAKCRARQAIFDRALSCFQLSEVELLISAFGADRRGRALTEAEAAAKQVYRQAVERQCHAVRVRAPSESERRLDIHQAVIMALAQCVCSADFDLVVKGYEAAQYGRALAEREAVAMQAYMAQYERLCQGAGFDSTAAFESFCGSAEFSAGGDRL